LALLLRNWASVNISLVPNQLLKKRVSGLNSLNVPTIAAITQVW